MKNENEKEKYEMNYGKKKGNKRSSQQIGNYLYEI